MNETPGRSGDAALALEGREKERAVERMFDEIATPYDRLNRLISLGRDAAWRRKLVARSGVRPGDRVADLGTGTGDLALLFAETTGPEGEVVGVDIAAGMLALAEAKGRARGRGIHLARASASATGLPDAWADVASMGFVLRNVVDRPAVYAEALRVLAPGGRFLVLDTSHPSHWPGRIGFALYRHALMPLLARLAGGELSAYRYLAQSTDRFPPPGPLAEECRAAGFTEVTTERLMMGSIVLLRAVKPA